MNRTRLLFLLPLALWAFAPWAQALVGEARARPGTVALAHSGSGSLSHLASELLQQRSGGRIQAVAMAAEQRLPVLPQLPTLAEQGIKDMVLERLPGRNSPASSAARALGGKGWRVTPA